MVDRPANPACTLVMAKSVGSDIIQVEELTMEDETQISVEEAIAETPKTAGALIEMAKAIASETTNKFDQGMFDMARRGLAGLLAVEATEMAEGSDESASIERLLGAIHALFEFHHHEAEEGETMESPEIEETEIELSDDAETAKEDTAEVPSEVPADGEDVEMCDKCNKSMKECKCAEGGYSATEMSDEEKSVKTTLEVSELRELIMEVVKSVTTTPEQGDDVVTKAFESERIEALESELAQVKALAAPTGPKRMAQSVSAQPNNVAKSQAQIYRAKAAATLDKTLATGYLKLAADLEKSESN